MHLFFASCWCCWGSGGCGEEEGAPGALRVKGKGLDPAKPRAAVSTGSVGISLVRAIELQAARSNHGTLLNSVMTPLQNDIQQHQRRATNRKHRIPCGGKRNPDSESARRELSKSGIASHFGTQKIEFKSNSGFGALPALSWSFRCLPESAAGAGASNCVWVGRWVGGR
jgi:hypothetical protein